MSNVDRKTLQQLDLDTSAGKKRQYKQIYGYLSSNGIPFQFGWRGVGTALKNLLKSETRLDRGSQLRITVVGLYRQCREQRPDLPIPTDFKWQTEMGVSHKRDVSLETQLKRFYRSLEWRKLRFATLQKYGRSCMCCGTSEGTMHVDHIKSLRYHWALRLDPDNLQVLCAPCNHGKGARDQTDFRPVIRPRIIRREIDDDGGR